MNPSTLEERYCFYAEEKCSSARFTHTFGFDSKTLSEVFKRTSFWNKGTVDQFMVVYCVIKRGDDFARLFFGKSENTLRHIMWEVAAPYLYFKLKEFVFHVRILSQITLENLNVATDDMFLPHVKGVIDTTPFPIPKGTNFKANKENYSVHYGMYCWKYLSLVNRVTGKFCFVDGPYRGGIQDPTILNDSNLMNILPQDVYLFADRIFFGPSTQLMSRVYIAYRGDPRQLTDLENAFNYKMNRERVIIEMNNRRWKAYTYSAENPWRHSSAEHYCMVMISAGTVNIDLEYHPLFAE